MDLSLTIIFGSFVAGLITVLAPCVLPLLPVIIGGSVAGDTQDKLRPVIVVASLATSLFFFTIALKATTLLVDINPQTFTVFSGGIVILLGLIILFPSVYQKFMHATGIEKKSNQLLAKGYQNKKKYIGPAVTGAALGPVFSSCSPVYAYILATVFPVSFTQALIYISVYILGLATILFFIGYGGQRFVNKITFLSNPKGIFQRANAVLFIIVGILIITGYDKAFQVWVADNIGFDFDKISQQLIPDGVETSEEVFNIEPYEAPEIVGITEWIDTEPLTLSELEGQVVLVDFWTYSCINCIRSIPYLQDWYDRYQDKGFEIVGLHAPEFAFERNPDNVRDAIKEYGITYPVGLDNDFATWNNYDNRFWPAQYLIDANGQVRRVHFGEGEYRETEEAIRALLEESGRDLSDVDLTTSGTEEVPVTDEQTPETYLGLSRASDYVGSPALGAGENTPFTFGELSRVNEWSLQGRWDVGPEQITTLNDGALRFRFAAKEVYLVAEADNPVTVEVLLNGERISNDISGQDVQNGQMTIQDSELYRIVNLPEFT